MISKDKTNKDLKLLKDKKQEKEVVLTESEDQDQSEDESSEHNEISDNKSDENIQKIAKELVDKQTNKDENVQVQYGDKNTEVESKYVFKDGKMTKVTRKRTTQKLSLIKNVAEEEDVIIKKLPKNNIQKV